MANSSAKIAVADIVALRELTGAGMMSAKAALEEAGGDQDKAVAILRKKGEASAAKRSDRATEAGLIDAYIHNGSIGVLIEVNCETDFVARTDDFKTLVHDLAMHVAAHDPQYLTPDEVPDDVIEREKAIYIEEAGDKPAEIAAKMIAGKLDKYLASLCLLQQPYLKDDKLTVEAYIKQLIAKLGENITVRRFVRYQLGD